MEEALRQHRGLDIEVRGMFHWRAQDLHNPFNEGAPPSIFLFGRAIGHAKWMMELPAADNAVRTHARRHGK